MIKNIWKLALVLCVSALILLFFLNLGAVAQSLEGLTGITKDTWLNVVGTLIGAALGSGLAVWGALILQKETDKKNDAKAIRENATIVYFDLLLGLNDLKKLYIGYKTNDMSNTPNRMFFSSEWIKNVALLEAELKDKVEDIYLLYGDLLTIQDHLQNEETDSSMIEDLGGRVLDEGNIIAPLKQSKLNIKGWNDYKLQRLNIEYDLNGRYAEIIMSLDKLRQN